MRRDRLRLALALTCVAGATSWLACGVFSSSGSGQGSADAGGGTVGQDGAQSGQGSLSFTPTSVSLLPGATATVQVIASSADGFAGPVTVQIAPQPLDGAATPLNTPTASLSLTGSPPQGTFAVNADSNALDGYYGMNVVAAGTSAKTGGPLTATATLPVRIVGAAGQLDTGFGGPMGYMDLCPGQASACAPGDVYAYPDGRSLVVGSGGPGQFLALRFLRDGALDPSFGTGGYSLATLAGIDATAVAIAAFGDGTFAIGIDNNANIVLLHLLDNGTLDPSWGSGGVVTTDLSREPPSRIAMASTPSGVLVAGYKATMMPPAAVHRYAANGDIDSTFGAAGTLVFSVSPATFGTAVVVGPAGDVILGGEVTDGGAMGAASFLVQIDDAGQPGNETFVSFSDNAENFVGGMALQGNALLAASSFSGLAPQSIGVVRFNSATNLDRDNTFAGGAEVVNAGTNAGFCNLIVQPDGGAFLIGSVPGASSTFGVARYTSNGNTDLSFGPNGVPQPLQGTLTSMAITADGLEVIVVGTDTSITPPQIRVARYWL